MKDTSPQLHALGIPDARESRRFVLEQGHFQLFRRPLVVHLIGDRWQASAEDMSILLFHCSALPMLGAPGLSTRQHASTRTAVLLSRSSWRFPSFQVAPRGFWHRYARFIGQAEARVDLSPDFRKRFFLHSGDAKTTAEVFGSAAQRALLDCSESTWVEAKDEKLLVYRRTHMNENQRASLVQWACALSEVLVPQR